MSLFAEQFPVVFQALNEGFLQTLKLFFITLVGSIPLGLVICLGSMSRFRPLRYLVRLVIWVVRGTPLMLQLLIIYFFPGLVLKNNIWGQGELGRFAASCAAFVFNYACYFSEIYRGGIQSIPKGQTEAGQAFMKGSHGIHGAIWPLFFTGVYYLVFSGLLTLGLGWLERKLDYFKA